jgi:hypothetical protein
MVAKRRLCGGIPAGTPFFSYNVLIDIKSRTGCLPQNGAAFWIFRP